MHLSPLRVLERLAERRRSKTKHRLGEIKPDLTQHCAWWRISGGNDAHALCIDSERLARTDRK
jgi:hypothetical protein